MNAKLNRLTRLYEYYNDFSKDRQANAEKIKIKIDKISQSFLDNLSYPYPAIDLEIGARYLIGRILMRLLDVKPPLSIHQINENLAKNEFETNKTTKFWIEGVEVNIKIDARHYELVKKAIEPFLI